MTALSALQAGAACAGEDWRLFFPPESKHPDSAELAQIQAAKRVCFSCTVRNDCLDYAIEAREAAGIWGGRSTDERRIIRRRRQRGVA